MNCCTISNEINKDFAASVTNEVYHKGIFKIMSSKKKMNRIGLINTFKGRGAPLEEIVPLVKEHTLRNTSLVSFGKA